MEPLGVFFKPVANKLYVTSGYQMAVSQYQGLAVSLRNSPGGLTLGSTCAVRETLNSI